MLKLARQFPGRIFLSVLLGFSGALFNGINIALIFPILLQLLGQEAQYQSLPKLLQYLTQPFEAVPEQYRLTVMLLAILGTIVLKGMVTYLNTLTNVSLRRGLVNTVRANGFRMLMDVDLAYFDQMQIGDITRRLNVEVNRAVNAIISYVKAINVVITILVFLGILVSLSWPLTIAATLVATATLLPSQLYNRRAKKLGRQLSEANRAISVHLLEVLNGMRLIRTVGTENREYQKLVHLIFSQEKTEFKSQMNAAAIGPINEITGIVSVILIILFARIFFADKVDAFSAVLLVYLVILFRMLPFVGQLNAIRNQLGNSSASVEVMQDFISLDNKPFMLRGQTCFQGLEHNIEFKDITFHYPSHEKLVLSQVSLTLPKGQTLALVGSSGSGKSTLADLLARFYDPTAGCIMIDGVDMKMFDLASLRRSMGVVSQDTFLFNETVRNNICYPKPDASDQAIFAAAKRANAYDFILELPQQWDTLIGDRGVMLSGGQRQRLAIARAILQDPEILILDEATSALDTVSERLVQQAIDELSHDRTILVIAHRLSTVRNADQIAVMDQGKVVEVGTHEELLSLGGKYRELCEMQFGDQLLTTKKGGQKLSETSYYARTNLNSMLGALSLISDNLLETDEERELVLDDIQRSAQNILEALKVLENQDY
ncbi:ABC transporter ATP-binding protein [Oscillatoria sp. CS-180]|uniref:ABC transporter ATP-binding protein n=1 Tax=Oscillatoria sp. CS-180 TaxID=3021720 RepID=UPI00232DFEC2|nr:ABC transporter ATP-binding protein [Oscillatoria sp. CS-180]MDB9526887.1 ABC transporter ATP-binding protein [Oscillatoria sp. CS-180]